MGDPWQCLRDGGGASDGGGRVSRPDLLLANDVLAVSSRVGDELPIPRRAATGDSARRNRFAMTGWVSTIEASVVSALAFEGARGAVSIDCNRGGNCEPLGKVRVPQLTWRHEGSM
jgi:hypothetical protein